MNVGNIKRSCFLLFACFAVFTATMAAGWDGRVQWPANYSTTATGFNWTPTFIPPNNTPVPTAEIDITPNFYDEVFHYATNFSTMWEAIATPEYPIDKLRESASPLPAGASLGKWKATHDGSYIYVLVCFADPNRVTVVNNNSLFEVTISPYYKLEGYTGVAPGVPYVRYSKLGGHKFDVRANDVYYLSIDGNSLSSYYDDPSFNVTMSMPTNLFPEVKDFTSGTTFERIVAIPFAALDDLENNRPFDLDVWNAVNGGKGIAFGVNYMSEEENNRSANYLWSTTSNDVYYSNVGAGYLKLASSFDDAYNVVVTNGTPDKVRAYNGDIISITASEPPTNKVFDKWDSSYITFADAYNPTTTFVMPPNAVYISATYKGGNNYNYYITINGGTGVSTATYNQTVTITANEPEIGKVFDKWISSDGVAFAKASSATTTFTMPDKSVTVTATYKEDYYNIAVTGGSANFANVKYNIAVNITANEAPAGKVFDQWTSDDGVVFATTSATTTFFMMPNKPVTVRAIYKDKEAEEAGYNVTVTGGTATPEKAEAGTTVAVTAAAPASGETFKYWMSEDGVIFADKKAATTTFTMPNKPVTLTALSLTVSAEQSITNNPWIYPNPAADYVTILGVNDVDYSIADITGAEILAATHYDGEPIYVGDLLPGVYFIRVGNKTLPFVKK